MSEMAVEMGMFVGSMLQQVLDCTCTLQLVREMLSMLEVKDAARVELHIQGCCLKFSSRSAHTRR